jgi:hypothetical protein
MAEAAAGVDGEQPELETQQEGGEGEEEGVAAGVSMSEDEAVLVVGGAAAAAGSGETAVQGSTEYQAGETNTVCVCERAALHTSYRTPLHLSLLTLCHLAYSRPPASLLTRSSPCLQPWPKSASRCS